MQTHFDADIALTKHFSSKNLDFVYIKSDIERVNTCEMVVSMSLLLFLLELEVLGGCKKVVASYFWI
jgi:hypothetical protein